MPRPLPPPARLGVTLPELLLVIALLAIVAAMSLTRIAGLHDRLAARGAAGLLTRALFDARHAAWRLGTRVAVRVDTALGRATIGTMSGPLALHDLRTVFGVTLEATRDSLAYLPDGLAYGASNARFIVARGAAAETVTVSRVGRVRR
ncbi:MAG: prepilin-type N-terminal cleavage/methylation domain-containing protein [Gemmatimonadaceae bacterium]|nr:prepilin-type N-terminal cleavage/methylation domain-containing protein [Gemmatimonadaceae bacterium]